MKFTFWLFCIPLFANDVYLAQASAGGNTGANCANALAGVTYFNTVGNWTSGTPSGTQIGPATTVHICGTWTGAANGTLLVAQGSGSSGSPVTVLFESGAVLTAPYWLNNNSSSGGAFNFNSKNYITLNCAGGTIQNSDNGTLLTYQKPTQLIGVTGDNSIIENCNLINAYVRPLGTLTNEVSQQNELGIVSGNSTTNLTISGNVMHDCGWCIFLTSTGSDNVHINNNEVYNAEHNVILAPAHFWINDNKFHDWANWDAPAATSFGSGNSEITFTTTALSYLNYATVVLVASGNNTALSVSVAANANCTCAVTVNLATNGGGVSTSTVAQVTAAVVASMSVSVVLQAPITTGNGTGVVAAASIQPLSMGNHHDGIHCFAGYLGQSVAGYIYNNQFYGAVGASMNQGIYLEAGDTMNMGRTGCFASGGAGYIFNNVFLMNVYAASGFPSMSGLIGLLNAGVPVTGIQVNNTLISNNPGAAPYCLESQYLQNETVENNACGGSGFLVVDSGVGSNPTTYTAFDYNAYENCTSFNCFYGHGVDTGSFATWKTNSGLDTNSIANLGSSSYFNLDSNGAPNAGSPLIGAGANLTSLCTGQLVPLCKDINGHARPSTGAWTIGAYNYNAPGGGYVGGNIFLGGGISFQ